VIKALADETRLRIAALVYTGGDLCSCEIETILALEQSNASRHLRRLREAGVLESYKRAQWVHYRPNGSTRSKYPFVQELLDSASSESEAIQRDSELLGEYRASGFTCRTIHQWNPSRRRVSLDKVALEKETNRNE
jgi:ArsR family transcriptional regulator